MTLQVGDKAVAIPLRDGGRVAVRSGTISVGGKAVLIPGANGQIYAVRPASPQVGDKVIVYPLRNGGHVCLASAGSWGTAILDHDIRIYVYRRYWIYGDSPEGIPGCWRYDYGIRHGGDRTYEFEDGGGYPVDVAVEILDLGESIEIWVESLTAHHRILEVYYKNTLLATGSLGSINYHGVLMK